MYFVDLKNVSSDLDDDTIFNYFVGMGVISLMTPQCQVGGLTSRDRTLWFNTQECPSQLILNGTTALREIFFEGSSSPVFVQHKNRSLNVTSPLIVARKARWDQERQVARDRTPPVSNGEVVNVQEPPGAEKAPTTEVTAATPSRDAILDLAQPENGPRS
ncbi:hypothetical protein PRIC2_010172 [Phytophthora ramorum]